jgi:hypothetical protein
MPNRFKPVLILLAISLAACQSTKDISGSAPPPQDVTPGSTFTVIKDFLIPAGDSSVYFQDNQLYPQGRIKADDPSCQFGIAASTSAGTVIRAGNLVVSNVEYDEKGVGPLGIDVSITKIHLRSAATGDNYQLDCMLPRLSYGARFVTPPEIQGAVGGYMDLKVAP